MPINIFEGARRIAKLVAIVWALGISSFILMQSPYLAGTYYISASHKRHVSSALLCEYQTHFDAENITITTKKGTEAHVTLCFPPETKEFLVTIPSGVKYAVTAPVVATEQEVVAYSQEIAEFEDRLKKEEPVVSPSVPRRLQKPWEEDAIVLNWDRQVFAEHIKHSLVLSQADEDWIDGQWREQRWYAIWQGLVVLVTGMAFLWAFTWSIGWIVRGFLGIPRGQDHKTM